MDTSIVDKVVEQLKALPSELQWRVLEFTRALSLSAPRGALENNYFALPEQCPLVM